MTQPPPTLELLSLHVPKCGGNSLGVALKRAFGDEALLLDYGDQPGDPGSPMNVNPDDFFRRAHAGLPGLLQGKRAVHGHFHPRKYQPVKVGFRTAIIREPLARLVSHYYFWQQLPAIPHSLHKYFKDNNLSIEQFARLPFIRNFYTQVFFAGLKLEDFDFIGTLETLPQSFATIGEGIGHRLKLVTENKGESREYREGRAEILGNSALRGRLAHLLESERRFYDEVRARWS